MQMTDRPKLLLLQGTTRANVNRLGYIGRTPTEKPRDADSWYTPPEYLDSVRMVMGAIDLDPFTSKKANEIVGARHTLTIEKSAFDYSWKLDKNVRVFMNPPYSAGLCGRAVNRFIDQYEARNFAEGIVLVNNATDTRWFCALLKHCNAICFTDHRISFWNADRKMSQATHVGRRSFTSARSWSSSKRSLRSTASCLSRRNERRCRGQSKRPHLGGLG
jgi:hypothetical protein